MKELLAWIVIAASFAVMLFGFLVWILLPWVYAVPVAAGITIAIHALAVAFTVITRPNSL